MTPGLRAMMKMRLGRRRCGNAKRDSLWRLRLLVLADTLRKVWFDVGALEQWRYGEAAGSCRQVRMVVKSVIEVGIRVDDYFLAIWIASELFYIFSSFSGPLCLKSKA